MLEDNIKINCREIGW